MYEVMLRTWVSTHDGLLQRRRTRPRVYEREHPYYAGCGLYKCADGYRHGAVGITQINLKVFKDILARPHSR